MATLKDAIDYISKFHDAHNIMIGYEGVYKMPVGLNTEPLPRNMGIGYNTTVCPYCGQRNNAIENDCQFCGGRLG